MPHHAFTGGVKPGGLTTSTEIRILLCYLLSRVSGPLSRQEIENALVGQQLVNYFELADALSYLCEKGHVICTEDLYTVSKSGRNLADTLETDLPRTVRETAVNTVISMQAYARKKAQYHTRHTPCANGFTVHCAIEDLGQTIFSLDLYMPDESSARAAEARFAEQGGEIFTDLLNRLSGI
ncbi:MAG: DUF4364 family protein [Pygmaiobacter massiliensis]|nr:DUF4364 family protein [Pygmaiobacter massiliensis]